MNDLSKEEQKKHLIDLLNSDLSPKEIMEEEFTGTMLNNYGKMEIEYIEDAMKRYADQQSKKEAIAYEKEIEKLNRIIDLKESERKEWVESCIKKQEEIEILKKIIEQSLFN